MLRPSQSAVSYIDKNNNNRELGKSGMDYLIFVKFRSFSVILLFQWQMIDIVLSKEGVSLVITAVLEKRNE